MDSSNLTSIQIKKEDLGYDEYNDANIKLEPNEERPSDNTSIQADEAALIAQSLFMMNNNDQQQNENQAEEKSENLHQQTSDNNQNQAKFTNDQYESQQQIQNQCNNDQPEIKSSNTGYHYPQQMFDSSQYEVKKEEEEEDLPSDASSDDDDADLARRMKLKSKFASSPVKNTADSKRQKLDAEQVESSSPPQIAALLTDFSCPVGDIEEKSTSGTTSVVGDSDVEEIEGESDEDDDEQLDNDSDSDFVPESPSSGSDSDISDDGDYKPNTRNQRTRNQPQTTKPTWSNPQIKVSQGQIKNPPVITSTRNQTASSSSPVTYRVLNTPIGLSQLKLGPSQVVKFGTQKDVVNSGTSSTAGSNVESSASQKTIPSSSKITNASVIITSTSLKMTNSLLANGLLKVKKSSVIMENAIIRRLLMKNSSAVMAHMKPSISTATAPVKKVIQPIIIRAAPPNTVTTSTLGVKLVHNTTNNTVASQLQQHKQQPPKPSQPQVKLKTTLSTPQLPAYANKYVPIMPRVATTTLATPSLATPSLATPSLATPSLATPSNTMLPPEKHRLPTIMPCAPAPLATTSGRLSSHKTHTTSTTVSSTAAVMEAFQKEAIDVAKKAQESVEMLLDKPKVAEHLNDYLAVLKVQDSQPVKGKNTIKLEPASPLQLIQSIQELTVPSASLLVLILKNALTAPILSSIPERNFTHRYLNGLLAKVNICCKVIVKSMDPATPEILSVFKNKASWWMAIIANLTPETKYKLQSGNIGRPPGIVDLPRDIETVLENFIQRKPVALPAIQYALRNLTIVSMTLECHFRGLPPEVHNQLNELFLKILKIQAMESVGLMKVTSSSGTQRLTTQSPKSLHPANKIPITREQQQKQQSIQPSKIIQTYEPPAPKQSIFVKLSSMEISLLSRILQDSITATTPSPDFEMDVIKLLAALTKMNTPTAVLPKTSKPQVLLIFSSKAGHINAVVDNVSDEIKYSLKCSKIGSPAQLFNLPTDVRGVLEPFIMSNQVVRGRPIMSALSKLTVISIPSAIKAVESNVLFLMSDVAEFLRWVIAQKLPTSQPKDQTQPGQNVSIDLPGPLHQKLSKDSSKETVTTTNSSSAKPNLGHLIDFQQFAMMNSGPSMTAQVTSSLENLAAMTYSQPSKFDLGSQPSTMITSQTVSLNAVTTTSSSQNQPTCFKSQDSITSLNHQRVRTILPKPTNTSQTTTAIPNISILQNPSSLSEPSVTTKQSPKTSKPIAGLPNAAPNKANTHSITDALDQTNILFGYNLIEIIDGLQKKGVVQIRDRDYQLLEKVKRVHPTWKLTVKPAPWDEHVTLVFHNDLYKSNNIKTGLHGAELIEAIKKGHFVKIQDNVDIPTLDAHRTQDPSFYFVVETSPWNQGSSIVSGKRSLYAMKTPTPVQDKASCSVTEDEPPSPPAQVIDLTSDAPGEDKPTGPTTTSDQQRKVFSKTSKFSIQPSPSVDAQSYKLGGTTILLQGDDSEQLPTLAAEPLTVTSSNPSQTSISNKPSTKKSWSFNIIDIGKDLESEYNSPNKPLVIGNVTSTPTTESESLENEFIETIHSDSPGDSPGRPKDLNVDQYSTEPPQPTNPQSLSSTGLVTTIDSSTITTWSTMEINKPIGELNSPNVSVNPVSSNDSDKVNSVRIKFPDMPVHTAVSYSQSDAPNQPLIIGNIMSPPETPTIDTVQSLDDEVIETINLDSPSPENSPKPPTDCAAQQSTPITTSSGQNDQQSPNPSDDPMSLKIAELTSLLQMQTNSEKGDLISKMDELANLLRQRQKVGHHTTKGSNSSTVQAIPSSPQQQLTSNTSINIVSQLPPTQATTSTLDSLFAAVVQIPCSDAPTTSIEGSANTNTNEPTIIKIPIPSSNLSQNLQQEPVQARKQTISNNAPSKLNPQDTKNVDHLMAKGFPKVVAQLITAEAKRNKKLNQPLTSAPPQTCTSTRPKSISTCAKAVPLNFQAPTKTGAAAVPDFKGIVIVTLQSGVPNVGTTTQTTANLRTNPTQAYSVTQSSLRTIPNNNNVKHLLLQNHLPPTTTTMTNMTPIIQQPSKFISVSKNCTGGGSQLMSCVISNNKVVLVPVQTNTSANNQPRALVSIPIPSTNTSTRQHQTIQLDPNRSNILSSANQNNNVPITIKLTSSTPSISTPVSKTNIIKSVLIAKTSGSNTPVPATQTLQSILNKVNLPPIVKTSKGYIIVSQNQTTRGNPKPFLMNNPMQQNTLFLPSNNEKIPIPRLSVPKIVYSMPSLTSSSLAYRSLLPINTQTNTVDSKSYAKQDDLIRSLLDVHQPKIWWKHKDKLKGNIMSSQKPKPTIIPNLTNPEFLTNLGLEQCVKELQSEYFHISKSLKVDKKRNESQQTLPTRKRRPKQKDPDYIDLDKNEAMFDEQEHNYTIPSASGSSAPSEHNYIKPVPKNNNKESSVETISIDDFQNSNNRPERRRRSRRQSNNSDNEINEILRSVKRLGRQSHKDDIANDLQNSICIKIPQDRSNADGNSSHGQNESRTRRSNRLKRNSSATEATQTNCSNSKEAEVASDDVETDTGDEETTPSSNPSILDGLARIVFQHNQKRDQKRRERKKQTREIVDSSGIDKQANSAPKGENDPPALDEELHRTYNLHIDKIKVESLPSQSVENEQNVQSHIPSNTDISSAENIGETNLNSTSNSIRSLTDLVVNIDRIDNVLVSNNDQNILSKTQFTERKSPSLSVTGLLPKIQKRKSPKIPVTELLPKLPKRSQEIVSVKLDFTSPKTRLINIAKRTTVEKEVKEASEKATHLDYKGVLNNHGEKISITREKDVNDTHQQQQTSESIDGNALINKTSTMGNEMLSTKQRNEDQSGPSARDTIKVNSDNGSTTEHDSSTLKNNERTAVEDTMSYLKESVIRSDEGMSENDTKQICTESESFSKKSMFTIGKVECDPSPEHSSECDQASLKSKVREEGVATLAHLKRKIENIDLKEEITASSKKLRGNPNHNPVVMVEKLNLDRISNRVNIVEGESDESLDSNDLSIDVNVEEVV
ncbi:mucin-17-like [Clytia hemisphaerica]|uniref:Uncharacterized protein n=1 Tax=Clytia hemisphaerica TaxID=252671 RepID=A0A7M5V9X6_9CNID